MYWCWFCRHGELMDSVDLYNGLMHTSHIVLWFRTCVFSYSDTPTKSRQLSTDGVDISMLDIAGE
jgi:hypothetical protein